MMSTEPNQVAFTWLSDLVSALKARPGCLGVELAQTASGKNVIFAWFDDKAAVLRWYYSDVHRRLQQTFFGNLTPREPLQGVPDESGPIMAVASLTLSPEAHFQDTSLPISQIAIELYQPLTGGFFLGSRFAPDQIKVREVREPTVKENLVRE